MLFAAFLPLAMFWALAAAEYSEALTFRPLPRNRLLASFQFDTLLPPAPLEYVSLAQTRATPPRHYGSFPKALEPVLASTNTRQLHLRFTQGWWDEKWGSLPANGAVSGGTGVEVWAAIEAQSVEEARAAWFRLTESLSGFFCALLNFVSDAITTYPRYGGDAYAAGNNTQVYLMRAALPDEPICTENLTPFLKLLPTRGRAGIASLLDGHKLYDSLWHAMSIDMAPECSAGTCRWRLRQGINHIVDVMRLERRRSGGGIPKPVAGDDLRCDTSKYHDSWTCFPLGDETELLYDVEGIFGRRIRGAGFDDTDSVSLVRFETPKDYWKVQVHREDGDSLVMHDVGPDYVLVAPVNYNFVFNTTDSRRVLPAKPAPVLVSRSLTGYSQDRGGVRVKFKNISKEPVSLVYSETLPWFMRVYLHTLVMSGSGKVTNQWYRPAIDRVRPGHLDLEVTVPAGGDFSFTYDFDKSLLLYAEYPPDANHGFSIEPAVVRVMGPDGDLVYQMRTASLLLTLPTPDFSMPYNVIILTCTVMSLAFGTLFNLLTKKVVTEEEFEALGRDLRLGRLKERIATLKSRIKGTSVSKETPATKVDTPSEKSAPVSEGETKSELAE